VEKKVLLFYINTIHDGGAERVILQLAHHFAQAGYRSILVNSFADKNEYPVPPDVERVILEPDGPSPSRLRKNLTRILGVRALCKKEHPAALISFMFEPTFRSVFITAGLPVKNIISIRNDPVRLYAGAKRVIGRCLLPTADGCVFQTEDARDWFPEKLQKKSTVIMNDVDPVFFETQCRPGGDVITLGRLSAQKNQRLLLQAFAKIAPKYPDRRLLVYGIGPLEGSLRQEIADLGLQDRILLMGLTSDAPQVLSQAGVFVLSSDYEGMPNALLEALVVGVPCISTDCPCGGPKSLIRDGANGLLVPVGDVDRMAAALDTLLGDPAYAARLGKAARDRAKALHPDQVFAQWRAYVEKVLAR